MHDKQYKFMFDKNYEEKHKYINIRKQIKKRDHL